MHVLVVVRREVAAAGEVEGDLIGSAARTGYHARLVAQHAVVLQHLGIEPLFDLQLRLGEGTGATLALPLLDAACAIMSRMATFDEANVSDKQGP